MHNDEPNDSKALEKQHLCTCTCAHYMYCNVKHFKFHRLLYKKDFALENFQTKSFPVITFVCVAYICVYNCTRVHVHVHVDLLVVRNHYNTHIMRKTVNILVF